MDILNETGKMENRAFCVGMNTIMKLFKGETVVAGGVCLFPASDISNIANFPVKRKVKEMRKGGLSIGEIAKLTGKGRTTIFHHLNYKLKRHKKNLK